MSSLIVAKKYARAFAKTVGVEDAVSKSFLGAFVAIEQIFAFKESRDVLNSLVMPNSLKQELLTYALDQGKAPQSLRSFVEMVVNARRVFLLLEIIDSYLALVDEANNRLKAKVVCFSALSVSQKERLQQQLESLFKKKVNLEVAVDTSLLGGFTVSVQHKLIDCSLKFRLDLLTAKAAL